MSVTSEAIRTKLSEVLDPEIRRPITELDMVRSVEIDGDHVTVGIDLTTEGCPLRGKITGDVTAKVQEIEGVAGVSVEMGVMSDEQKTALRTKLRGGVPEPVIPFAQPGSLTRVYAVTSGKGGVGKSSVTANLAVALSNAGLKVGVVDADIYGFSIPRMLGVEHPPTKLDDMIIPPVAHGIKVISIGMFAAPGTPVIWRGPMLHRAMQQFLGDVFWGDLDVLLLDLPPGTGDIAISVAQLIPNSEILVVTTPQVAAAEVAQRAGIISAQTRQHVVGVVENMSYFELPDGSRQDIFGSGGGEEIARQLSLDLGYEVPLLAQIPLDVNLREGGDSGAPVVLSAPESASATALSAVAGSLAKRARGLSGRSLSVTPR